MPKQQHYVTFYSPGTFFAETTAKPIKKWDVDEAVEMAHAISERYGARPYGFRFSTRGRDDDELDSRELRTSHLYYLGGRIETIAEIEARNDPDDRILLSNMRCNEWDRIVVNDNSWRWSQPLGKDDVVLDVKLREPPKDIA